MLIHSAQCPVLADADAASEGGDGLPGSEATVEINPDHEIVKKLLAHPDDARADDAAWLLFDQALLMEGVALKDPASFVQRLNRVLSVAI